MKVASDLVDLLGVVRPNRQACVGGLTVELGLATVGNQMHFQTSFKSFVVNLQQFFLAIVQLLQQQFAFEQFVELQRRVAEQQFIKRLALQ